MIVFKKLTYKNFLSTGDQETTIYLNKDKATLVVGHNGSGKSTMLDALSFALFGKPHRAINKGQLMNIKLFVELNQISLRYIKMVKC
mgnify:CR=1 FL=1